MTNYSKVESESYECLECLTEAYNLFALFDTPANVIFADQFISNIEKFKDIFTQYFCTKMSFFHVNVTKALHY